jgi:type I restriction enzyme S subunit
MSILKELLKDLPVEWNDLIELVEILDSKRKPISKSQRISGIYPYYGANGVQDYVNDYLFDGTYLLIGEDGSVINEDGSPVINWATGKIWVNNHAHILAEKTNTSLRYLYYYLSTIDVRKIVKGNIPKITQQDLRRIQIPIPYPNDPEKSLKIQQEIVRVLDGLSEQNKALTSALAQEIDQRKKQYEYYREDLFRFEGKEVEWKTLGEVAENLDAMRKPVKSGSRDLGDIPYYGASGIVDYVKDYIFDGDFLLVSEDGANLLARSTPIAFSISGKSWVNNHAHILKFENQYHRKLVEYYLNSIDLEPYITGAAQPKLNQKNLNKIKVPVIVQELELERVVSLLDKYDEATKSIVAQLEKEIALRNKQYAYYRDLLLRFTKD